MIPEFEQYDGYINRLFNTPEGHTSSTTVTLQVTDACNLACTYCYQINKHTNRMSFETGKLFIDNLLDGNYDKYGHYNIVDSVVLEFIGGEPFLEIELVDKLTDYFIQAMIDRNHKWLHRFRISICSNGVLYFDSRVQEYIKKHSKHLSFSVSIDGNKKLHDSCRIFPDGSGSYDIAIKAVEHYMTHYDGNMGSKMTIAPGNVEYVNEAVQGLFEKGYRDINLNCVYEEGWTVEHAKILYSQLKQLADYMLETGRCEDSFVSIFNTNFFRPKEVTDIDNWCGGTGKMLSCDYKGDLYPCIRYMESSLGTDADPIIIGNVNTGILATKEQCSWDKCLKCIDRRTQSTDECFYCPIAEGCSWCSAYNYQCFGTPDKRATYICIMHKARCLANAYYWNKYYRIFEPEKRFRLYIPDEWALDIIEENELKLLKLLSN